MTTPSASRTLAWLRQFAKLWGFALFCVFVVYLFREVALPFLFAILVAYILAPLVARMASCASAARPLPRWAGGHHPLRLHPGGAGALHRVLRPQALGRLRAPVPRSAALFAQGEQGVAARAGAWIDTHFGAESDGPDDDVTGRGRAARGAARDRRRAARGRRYPHQSATRSASRSARSRTAST